VIRRQQVALDESGPIEVRKQGRTEDRVSTTVQTLITCTTRIFLVFPRQDIRELVFDVELELSGDPRQMDAKGPAQFAKRAVKGPACPVAGMVCV